MMQPAGRLADAPKPIRPCRSVLVAPGSSERFITKAATSNADMVLIDLEDAVALDDKAAARARTIEALNTQDFGAKSVAVRINAPDTPLMYQDLIAVAEQAGPRLDLIMAPKIGSAADLYMLDVLLTQIEAATGRSVPIGLEVQIETAQGLQNVDAIAAASRRLEGIHFGPGDFAASIGARTTSIGGFVEAYGVLSDADSNGSRNFYPGDPWHYVLARIVVAARAADVRPVDGPYADFKDDDGLAHSARRAAALGFAGKWAIHPSQVDTINAAFSPSAGEIDAARAIIEALEEAQSQGRGAVTVAGRMVDAASIRQARQILAKLSP